MDRILGKELYNIILAHLPFEKINEIRIRVGRPVLVKSFSDEFFLDYVPNKEFMARFISEATSHSYYAYEQQISDGFLSYKKGIRIGVCGDGKMNEKKLLAFSDFTSFCVRIPHIFPFENNLKRIIDNFKNTLIVGPPFSGKTTLIRKLANELSDKYDTTVIDERKEIAGGDLSYLTGKRADIIQGIPKENLFGNIIRSMSPKIVVCDELFSEKDFNAVKELTSSGILCLASFHACSDKFIPKIISEIFYNRITLSSKPHPGNIISTVFDDD